MPGLRQDYLAAFPGSLLQEAEEERRQVMAAHKTLLEQAREVTRIVPIKLNLNEEVLDVVIAFVRGELRTPASRPGSECHGIQRPLTDAYHTAASDYERLATHRKG